MTVSACRKSLTQRLAPIADDCAGVEAEMILLAVMGCSRSFLYTYPDRIIDSELQMRIDGIADRRMQGEPLQYILGSASFMGLEFIVRPGVLIPRRDTEILVENALPYCAGKRVLDLCTGSGCIGIAVARLGTPVSVALSDVSPDALAIAGENAKKHNVALRFYQGDFLQAIPEGEKFDVLLSNPPYITTEEMKMLPLDVRLHEPELALKAGSDGLDAYRAILQDVSRVLVPGGYLFFEIGYAQGDAVQTLLTVHGFQDVAVVQDYGGQDRVVQGRLKCVEIGCET